MPEINYLAVLASAVVAMVMGGIWYGPLFGKLWMEGMGWDPNNRERLDKMKKSVGSAYIQQFIGALLMAYVLAHVLWAFRVALPDMVGVAGGLQGGLWTWLGYVLPVKYGDKLWSGKKFKYVAVDLAYYLVLLLVTGVILAVWR